MSCIEAGTDVGISIDVEAGRHRCRRRGIESPVYGKDMICTVCENY